MAPRNTKKAKGAPPAPPAAENPLKAEFAKIKAQYDAKPEEVTLDAIQAFMDRAGLAMPRDVRKKADSMARLENVVPVLGAPRSSDRLSADDTIGAAVAKKLEDLETRTTQVVSLLPE